MSRFLPAVMLSFLAATASAHPLPNLRFDRTIHVRLAADGVVVRYSLDLNDWTMVLDGKDLVTPADTKDSPGQMGFARAYAKKKAVHIADNLRATLDGTAVTFKPDKIEVEPERDHLRVRYVFRADWRLTPGWKHKFAFEDQNFESRNGSVMLTQEKSGTGIELSDEVEPIDLRNKSPLELQPGDEQRLRKASATILMAGTAPEPTPLPSTQEVTVGPSAPDNRGALERGLKGLFDSGYGFGIMLLLAFFFGAGHAFTPGHGKTLVAAYLIGERGTIKHACVLGLVTTLAHTGSVIAVGVFLRSYFGDTIPDETAGVLTLAGGLLIAVIGLWLFLQRARGRADHVHLFADHHHHHGEHCDHDHSHGHDHHHHHGPAESPKTNFGWLRVILLGLGGGIVPCWDAVMLLVLSISTGRLGIAVPLLLSFSAGLAAVLVALGIGVVLAHRYGGRSFGDARWFKALPVISAVLLIIIGIWFARDGVALLTHEVPPAQTRP